MKVTVLGCGASAGVPLIGCDCAVCTSDNPKNDRTRSSVLIESATTRILVDAGPDLRRQALRTGFKTIDALVITHAHADHCHGIDEIRSFNFHADAPIPVYADAQTMRELQERFAYMFQPPQGDGIWFRGALIPQIIDFGREFTIGDITLKPFEQEHGKGRSTGLRIHDFVYSTDVNNFPNDSCYALDSISDWLVDCLRYEAAPAHAHLELVLEWIERFRPQRAWLTHMSHCFEYDAFKSSLPEHVQPVYDGMVISV
jgi:phosphoribosyl 1,2-cyclic phosphate phosphodiesterase